MASAHHMLMMLLAALALLASLASATNALDDASSSDDPSSEGPSTSEPPKFAAIVSFTTTLSGTELIASIKGALTAARALQAAAVEYAITGTPCPADGLSKICKVGFVSSTVAQDATKAANEGKMTGVSQASLTFVGFAPARVGVSVAAAAFVAVIAALVA